MNKWNVGGVSMAYPIMIGGGVCKTPQSLIPYLNPDLPIGPREIGSITPDEAGGNLDAPQEFWIDHLNSGLNSWGMPNLGIRKTISLLDQMSLPDKSIIANVAAFSPEGFAAGYEAFASRPYIAAVVGNFSCPNKHLERRIPISLDLESLELALQAVSRVTSLTPFWVKIAPVFYPEDLVVLRGKGFSVLAVPTVEDDYLYRLAEIISRYGDVIRAVVTTNTGPNFSYLVDGKSVTRPNGGLAGLSGELLRPYARRTARGLLAYVLFMDVIAAGGIMTGDHVVESITEDGCAGVQVTSLPHWFGPKSLPGLVEGSERLQQLLIRGPQ